MNEGATPSKEPGEYVGLIRNLFDGPAVVAILGGYSALSEGIAAELSEPHKGTGRRVVITDIRRVLQITPLMLPDASDFVPGKHPNVWLWPAPSGQKLEFFRSREVTPIVTAGPGNWLDSLRRSFDAVLLDCPALEGSPSVAEVAAMADGAVLAVEAGLTLKQQIQRDQECLRLRGVKVAGCILIQRS